ncbi:hypothetical protein C8Q80DRAFT_335744 [Daedaleopsis nitida]|nr:hypothetical protein C8Q80DRAFT_335744 [Daedaleopsis nitida]
MHIPGLSRRVGTRRSSVWSAWGKKQRPNFTAIALDPDLVKTGRARSRPRFKHHALLISGRVFNPSHTIRCAYIYKTRGMKYHDDHARDLEQRLPTTPNKRIQQLSYRPLDILSEVLDDDHITELEKQWRQITDGEPINHLYLHILKLSRILPLIISGLISVLSKIVDPPNVNTLREQMMLLAGMLTKFDIGAYIPPLREDVQRFHEKLATATARMDASTQPGSGHGVVSEPSAPARNGVLYWTGHMLAYSMRKLLTTARGTLVDIGLIAREPSRIEAMLAQISALPDGLCAVQELHAEICEEPTRRIIAELQTYLDAVCPSPSHEESQGDNEHSDEPAGRHPTRGYLSRGILLACSIHPAREARTAFDGRA